MDDLERQLRDLGERVDRSVHGERLPPRTDVHSRSRKRRSAAIVTSSLVTFGLIAVGVVGVRSLGGRSGTAVGSNVLASAADATEAQVTALFDFEMTMRMESSGMDRDIDAEGSGQVDFSNERTYMRIEGIDEESGSEIVETIQDGDVAYTRSEGQDKWLRTELPGGFNSQQQFRPDDYLEYLREVSLSVERMGEEEIDGVVVTRYRAYMDLERMAEQAGEEAQEALESFDYTMEPSDVWVDAAGLVRRMTFGTTFSGGFGDESMEMEMSAVISFHDFGAPIDITIPDESEVMEIEVGEDSGGSASASASESVEVTEGERADSESHILLMTSDDLSGLTGEVFGSSMCVFRAPEWATRVDLMVDGRSVASFGEQELEEPDDGTPRECQWVPDIRDEIRKGDSLTFQVTGASRTMEFEIVEVRRL